MKFISAVSKVPIPERIECPPIPPLPEGTARPFWSVMIPTYNRTTYLEQTLRSVLEQDPGPDKMQIEVVDNCSTEGDMEAVVRELGRGRVSFYRQSANVGMTANWNTCVMRARGRWIHILHDDDEVMPGFYEKYEQLIGLYPDATLVTGPTLFIDERDNDLGVSERLSAGEGPVSNFAFIQATRNCLNTPSVVVRREAYEKVGGFYEALCYAVDWEMFFRAGTAGQVVTAAAPYCRYRVHSGSATSLVVLTGRNIQESVFAVDLLCSRLPERLKRELASMRYQWVAEIAEHCSGELTRKKHWKGSLVQATWAMRLRPNRQHLKLWLRAAAGYLTRNQYTLALR